MISLLSQCDGLAKYHTDLKSHLFLWWMVMEHAIPWQPIWVPLLRVMDGYWWQDTFTMKDLGQWKTLGAHWSGQILSSGYGKFTVELQVDNQTHCNKGDKPSTQILWRFAQQNPLITPLLKPIPSAFDLSTAGTSQRVIAGILFCTEFYLEEKWLHSLKTTNHSWWVKWLLRYCDNAYSSGDREFYGSAWSKLKRYAICEEDKRILQWGVWQSIQHRTDSMGYTAPHQHK